jgi:hypothetical protein
MGPALALSSIFSNVFLTFLQSQNRCGLYILAAVGVLPMKPYALFDMEPVVNGTG